MELAPVDGSAREPGVLLPRVLFSAGLLLVLTAAALLLFGWSVAGRFWQPEGDAPHFLERATAATVVAFGAWIGGDWLLALAGLLTAPALLLRTIVFLIAGVALLIRSRASLAVPRIDRTWWIFLAPTCLWVAFVVWRATIIPPLSHDALSNHLPRAVFFSRLHGFEDLTLISTVFKDMPANYELLLADVITMLGHDQYVEWVSALLYVVFAIAVGALAMRWWRSERVAVITMTLVACAPVLLLHAGAIKNDLLVGAFLVAGLVFAGRYWTSGDYSSLLLLGTALFIAVGTKNQAAGLGATLLPFVLVRMIRDLRAGRLSIRAAAGALVFGVAAFALLGGVIYVDQFLRPDARLDTLPRWAAARAPVTAYGDWANLWQGPYVMVAAPFMPNPYELYVPWDLQPWFWRRYEIYFAHFGVPFAVCMLAIPFATAGWRRGLQSGERRVIFIAALLALVLQLPAYFRPHGSYIISLGRYAMFIAAPVIVWSIGALLHGGGKRAFRLAAATTLVFFVYYGVDYAVNDRFAPLEFVLIAREFPGTRYIPFDPNRATSKVDEVAGPNDVIAIDGAWLSWIHPAFGPRLTRPVVFVPPGPGPVEIPDRADWVVVERAYSVIWGDKNMKSLADAQQLFHSNRPSEEELRVVKALSRDPRFELVWTEPRRNQAVFRRVRP